MNSYLRNLIEVLAIGAGFATIPLFAGFINLQPPWPPAIAYVSAGFVLIASLVVWEWVRNARTVQRRRWIVSALVLTLGGFLVYLLLYSLFVEPVPGKSARLVLGYECTPEAAIVYKDACPFLPTDALTHAEGDPLELWTRTSITNVRVALTLSWLVFVAGLIAAVGSVVAGRKVG